VSDIETARTSRISSEPALVGRRRLLAGAGVAAGAIWVAPMIVSVGAAAASSSLATVTAGDVTHVQGNNPVAVPLPVGTFTKYILVVSEVTTAAGNLGFLPTLAAGSGFTLLASNTATPPPNFAVYTSAAGTAAPTLTGNDTKGRWTAVVLGFTRGTTVTSTVIASSAASPISVTGATAAVASSWVFIGSASDGASATNWVAPSGFTKVLDVGGASNTPPDLFVAEYNSLSLTVPASSAAFGATDTAKAIVIGVG
jgi:hypothetical protein